MYRSVIEFKDHNQPNINQDAETLELAKLNIQSMLKQYAAVRQGFIRYPDDRIELYWPDGTYLFTIPARRYNEDEVAD